ncbi:hypothetical protein EV207_10985 [Scopulibacillus darangshiensis]|uniref:Uncharacterized protein n=1 Tax=Scopulibacillus darangshiensis TaxID=442528 RepID=A0A4R2P6L4_9BACL|nr:hypothetical protein [Scopulibacillus darangshiensis]TCP29631.1 hypothetical protein EV207_10985 [Scopulibacillus darangshiensis]
MFKNGMFKWMPYKEQNMCERKLNRVMRRLEIEKFNFNWDRSSCFIEFCYKEKSYRVEHSVQRAKDKGIILRNGLDCLFELIQSLENLCDIINRGTYKLETWIFGMKQSSPAKEVTEYEEEFHIRYKSLGPQKLAEYNNEELIPVAPESPLGDFDRN